MSETFTPPFLTKKKTIWFIKKKPVEQEKKKHSYEKETNINNMWNPYQAGQCEGQKSIFKILSSVSLLRVKKIIHP